MDAPVLVEVFGLVERQVLYQRLPEHAHPLLSSATDRLVRLLARDVDNVQGHASGVRDHDRSVGRLTLDLGRTRVRVPFRTSEACGHVLLLKLGHDVAVLGMHERHRAQLTTAFEGGVHLVVLDHERPFVGHEMFERGHATLDHLFHLVEDLLIPAGNGHVVRYVDGDLVARLCVPAIHRAQQRTVGARKAEIDQHCGSARSSRKSTSSEGLGGCGAHEGHL